MPVQKWRDVRSFSDLTPAIEYFHTLVERKFYDDAYSLFSDRLELATYFRLAAHRERIALLERLFPDGTNRPPALATEKGRCHILLSLATSYAESGQKHDATILIQQCLSISKKEGYEEGIESALYSLSEIYRRAGALRAAAGSINQTLGLWRGGNDEFAEAIVLVNLGYTLALAGDQAQACIALARSRKILAARKNQFVQSFVLAYFAELMLWCGDRTLALRTFNCIWKIHGIFKFKIAVEWVRILNGKLALKFDDLRQARNILYRALENVRTLKLVELEQRALISIAELEVKSGSLKDAHSCLDETWESAKEGPYPLYQADAYNVPANIYLAENDKPGAIETATKAHRAAWCDGPPWAYHWGLEKAKAHLQALGAPEPDMPPFDESKFEPMPEVEINPKDEYWVDPSESLEALLDLD